MRTLLLAAFTTAITSVSDPGLATAQTCGGDCNDDGVVTINELITAVNVVLGALPVDACPAIAPGGGMPGIANLIAAVSNSLCNCEPCPPPRDTATPTATPRPPDDTPTVTATPTPTPVVSTWMEDMFRLSGSTCPKQVNDAIRSELQGQSGTYRISQQDGTAVVENGAGEIEVVTIDDDGVLHDTFTDSDSEGSCVVNLDGDLAVPLRVSPTTATYHYRVNTTGCARNLHCQLTMKSRWTRTDLTL